MFIEIENKFTIIYMEKQNHLNIFLVVVVWKNCGYGECKAAAWYNINNIDKHKFLVPADLTIGQFIHVIRKRIKATPEKAIFIFVAKRILPSTASLISTIYEQYADDDGFLYILYSGENTFGMWLCI